MENDVLYNRVMNVVHEEYGPPGEGAKEITITENGTTTEDVRSYASAEITAAVPNSYTESDEGKVVDSGALVNQSSATYTENDTYDTTLINEVTVNVGGDPNENLVKYMTNQLTDVFVDVGNLSLHNRVLNESSAIINIHINGYKDMGTYLFHGCTGLKTVVLVADAENNAYAQQNMVSNCTSLEAVDFTNVDLSVGSVFATGNKPDFKTLILRKDTVSTLGNINVFTTTPFASDGTGGTIYVPSALISSYQSANNWSTILGYANNSIQAIEGSIYETQYADGTPIPTP